MREMEWIFCKPLETTELIEEFEKTSDFTFPETYKECVKQYAYGRPKGMVFKTEKYGDLTFRLGTFVKESMDLNVWKKNKIYFEYISYLEEKKEKEGLDSDEEFELKKCKFVIQNYVFFALTNQRYSELAFERKSGKIIMIEDPNYKPLISEVIADSFDEFIEEKLYKRESTRVYDDIEWDYFERLESESLIEEYEETINYTFPESFKNFVKKYNGAYTDDYLFDCTVNYDYCDEDETSFYFCSFNKGKNSMWSLLPLYDDVEIFKKKYVVFGKTFFGDFLAFKRSNGSVVFFEGDTMYHKTVGESFDDFLSNVYLNEDTFYIT